MPKPICNHRARDVNEILLYSHFLFVASVTTVSAKYPKIENDAILDDGG